MDLQETFAAFSGTELLAHGPIEEIVARLHPLSSRAQAKLLLFNETTGRSIDIDWRGKSAEVVDRAKAQLGSKPRGRPNLGVESREVTLLPRHWQWLERQNGNASATLRRLVEREMKQGASNREDVDSLYWQMSALAGDLPGFEEATRCLYASNWDGVKDIVTAWPDDVGVYFADRIAIMAAHDGRSKSAPRP